MSYKNFITEIPDFPKEGINFKDLSPLLADQEAFRSLLVDMGKRVRKEGKTPGDKVSVNYDLEYGSATLELPRGKGEVVIVDDVLATGGTLQATNKLANVAGYTVVGNLVAVDLQFVPRVENFDLNIRSVIKYED